jgi:hypothetical protein
MKELGALARAVIAFGVSDAASACSPDTSASTTEERVLTARLLAIDDASFRERGGEPFVVALRNLFLSHFRSVGKEPVGQWLWRKPISIALPLIRLLLLPHAEKAGILEAFDRDLDVKARFEEGSFAYSQIPESSQNGLSLVGEILINFYSEILASAGVPGYFVGTEANLDRQSVLLAFERANPALRVCPGCDGKGPSSDRNTIRADADHFFPKSKYPFLAIQPDNLTPLCKDCNQVYKRDRDVSDARGVESLADVYHPYFRPARDDVVVTVEGVEGRTEPQIKLRSRLDDRQAHARLNSLIHLLDLEERWQGDLTQHVLESNLLQALVYATQDERGDINFHPTEAWLVDKLTTVVQDMAFGIGRVINAIPTIAYAKWVVKDSNALKLWLEGFRAQFLLDTLPDAILLAGESGAIHGT